MRHFFEVDPAIEHIECNEKAGRRRRRGWVGRRRGGGPAPAAGSLEDPPLEDRNDEEGVEVFEAMSQVVLLVDDARDEQHRERVNDPI